MLKTITELRAECSAAGIGYSFGDDAAALQHKLDVLQQEQAKPEPVYVEPLPDDQLLRTKTPARVSSRDMIEDYLQPYTARGLHLTFQSDTWHLQWGVKEDSGPVRMPLRNIVQKAQDIMKDTVGG